MIALEAQAFFAHAAGDDLVEADEGSSADEEDVRGVDGGEFLVGMFASPLRRNVGDGAFQNLEQGLLHAFARDIAGNGGVFVFTTDFVDFVDVDDAGLAAGDVAIRRL